MMPDLRPLRLLLLAALGLPAASLALPACGDKDEDDDGGTDSGSTAVAACLDPVEVLDGDGVPTGYVRCEDGAVNRVGTREWDPTIDGERCAGKELERACETDADCTASPHGACLTITYEGGFGDACMCEYSCAKDSDCAPGFVCVGPGVAGGVTDWPECVPAACQTGDDCASGECGIESFTDGCGWNTDLICRSEADECRSDADCDDMCGLGWDADAFSCQEQNCTPGRPLRVEGVARTAPTLPGGDWVAHQAPVLPAQAADRARLARYWAEVGALEHASVGSFARFTLELLSLGAPPELVLATQQALADEVEHARLCYGLASAFAGRPLGPGPLDLSGVAAATDAAAIVAALVDEACLNETLAAAEAREAAATCADPVVQRALLRIAQDEARHAALGWRVLRWLVQARPELAPVAHQALEQGLVAVRGRAPGVAAGLPDHGLLSPTARHAVHLAALDQVVGPCARAVLG